MPQDYLTGIALFLVDAEDAAAFPTNVPIGKIFIKETKVEKSLKILLPNGNNHALIALPTYCPIACGQENP